MALTPGSKILISDLNLMPRSFASTAARDTFYTANPSLRVAGARAIIGSGATMQEYLYDGAAWLMISGDLSSYISWTAGFSAYLGLGYSGMSLTVRGGRVALSGAFSAASWAALASVLTISNAAYRPAVQTPGVNAQIGSDGIVRPSTGGTGSAALAITWPLTL